MPWYDESLKEALIANDSAKEELFDSLQKCTSGLSTGLEDFDNSIEKYNEYSSNNSELNLPKIYKSSELTTSTGASLDQSISESNINILNSAKESFDEESYYAAAAEVLTANHTEAGATTDGHTLSSFSDTQYTWEIPDSGIFFDDTLNIFPLSATNLAIDRLSISSELKGILNDLVSSRHALKTASACIEDADNALVRALDNSLDELDDADAEELAEVGIDEAAQKEALKDSLQEQKNNSAESVTEFAKTRFGTAPEFKEQCWLLSNIFDLARYKRNTLELLTPKPLPYSTTNYSSIEGDGLYSVKTVKKQSGGDFNACLMAHGDPYGFLNNLTQSPTQYVFFDMENKDISALQPQIRLYRINMDEDDSGQIKETEQEIFFASNYNPTQGIEELLVDKTKRGFGAGIKDFSFTYDGNNPFAVKKSISAKLNIFANSFDELLKDRGGYRYIDLALKTGTAKQGAEVEESMQQIIKDNLAKLNFRLKAVVGWALPKDSSTYFGGTKFGGATYKKDDLNSAVYDSFVTLNLTPTIHEFKIDQMGRVNFIIDYFAYVEDFFEQPNFNVFFDSNILHKRVMRKLKYQTISSKGKCNAEDMADIKKADIESNDVNWEKQESLRSIMKGLLTANKVNFINVPHKTKDVDAPSIENFNALGPYANKGKFNVSEIKTDQSLTIALAKGLEKEYAAMAAADDETLDEEQFAEASMHPSQEQVSFFYVSDLIDVILKGIDQTLSGMPAWLDPDQYPTLDPEAKDNIKKTKLWDKEISDEDLDVETKRFKKLYLNFKKLRVLLGPLEIINPADGGTSTFVNFGDVPISVKYFISWLTAKVLEKEETIYPLSLFLNDFFNNLVKEFLNNESCFDRGVKQATRLNQAVVTSYRNNGSQYDELTDIIKGQKVASRVIVDEATAPLLNISGYRGIPGGNPSPDNFGSKEINYYTFFAARTQPAEYMNGNRQEDEARGIFHYMLGKNRGIVKTINLSKTDAKFLKETRFESEGYDGLEQLREVYDVEIETYANVKTFPGTYIFVDPHGFAPSTTSDEGTYDLTQYGIGGYCMIYRSTTTLGEGQADTKISAKWVASIGAEGATEIAKKEKSVVDHTCPEAESAREEAKDDTGWWSSIIGG